MDKLKILILCDFTKNSANTIFDHITSFSQYSNHQIYYFNPIGQRKPFWLNLNNFNVLIIHYSILIIHNFYLDQTWIKAISSAPAIKIQFIQDEYRTVNRLKDMMNNLKINILYTCFPEKEIEKVYSAKTLPEVKKISTLTGYVPEYLEKNIPNFIKKRSIDVGYRARGIGFWWLGELYQEKMLIGQKFLEKSKPFGLKCDISNLEKDRIYGQKWLKFLQNCKCILGSASGASVIDFTGEIEKNVKKYIVTHPRTSFKEIQKIFLKKYEGKIKMGSISPRIFEAIANGCCLILFKDDYSAINLYPGKHYIELSKDFSNFNEVVKTIRNKNKIVAIAKRAYKDIIASGKYSYKSFIHDFDITIERYTNVKLKKNKRGRPKLYFNEYPILKKVSFVSKILRGIITYIMTPFFLRSYFKLFFRVIKREI